MAFEKIKIKDTIDIIFDNPRVSGDIKYKIIKRKEELDKFCNKHNLSSYLLGKDSFVDIEGLIPEGEVKIYDRIFKPNEFKRYLRSFELLYIKDELKKYIEKAVDNLVSDYNSDISFFISSISLTISCLFFP